jgi:hypothetical protein
MSAFALGGDPRAGLRALLAREYYADAVILCGSGTQALTLALRSALERAGASCAVALPAFCCFDVASAAIGAECKVDFYDLDPCTLAPSLHSLESVLASGARVVVIAPLYGIPFAWEPIEALATRYGAVVVEDAAQGHGASWRGRPLGALAEISTLSFGRGKGWSGGSGGAVLFRRSRLPSRMPGDSGLLAEIRNSLSLWAQWALGRPQLYGIPRSIPLLSLGETLYRSPKAVAGIACSAAAALLATHAAAWREAEVRKSNAHEMLSRIRGDESLKTITVSDDSVAGFLRLPIRAVGREGRSDPASRGSRLGIARSYPLALPDLPALACSRIESNRAYPGAATLVRELVTLPTHSRVKDGERVQITTLVAQT